MLGLDRRRALRWLGASVLVLAVGMLPWPGLKQGWSWLFAGLANVTLLSHVSFGAGGQAVLRPARPEERGTGENVATDAVLVLALEGYRGKVELGMSSRRDGFLPLLVFIAVAATAPLPWRPKLKNLAVGAPVMVCLCLTALWLGVAAVFASRLRDIYLSDSWKRSVLGFAEQVLLLPPANRFVVPLGLAALLSLWTLRKQLPRPDNTLTAGET